MTVDAKGMMFKTKIQDFPKTAPQQSDFNCQAFGSRFIKTAQFPVTEGYISHILLFNYERDKDLHSVCLLLFNVIGHKDTSNL